MGKIPGLAAVSNFFCAPTFVHRSPEELTSRAEKLILESSSTKSDASTLKGHDLDSASSMVGMDCKIKNLYGDVGSWSEKYPRSFRNASENDQTARFALIVRNRRSSDSRRKVEIESIVVQSPLLKRALNHILDGYPGVTTDLDRLEFSAPFQPFVHRWQRFEEATVNEKDLGTKQHLALLWDVLGTELRSQLQKIKDYRRLGVCDYDTLWTLFEPNCLVLTCRNGSERIYHCVKSSRLDQGYSLEAQYVDWDGERFGIATQNIMIKPFTGTRPLASLPASPLDRNPEKSRIKERILSRAKNFWTLQGYHYKSYAGIAMEATGITSARFNVDSRVIIDTAAFNLFNPKDQVKVTSLEASSSSPRRSEKSNTIELDNESEATMTSMGVDHWDCPWSPLSRDQLMICTDSVRAYSFKDKKWFLMFVDSLREITWDDDAFPSLVLPSDTKELILAFAESQVKRQRKFDDLIRGKGRGTILLLSGPPGVGKTLTAESVAEVMRVPLYMLSAGDLGTAPKEVEDTLTTTLAMTTKWKAVLLIDEADVFLLARNAHDLERNKLVSIFLRILEYYEGICFLTTNRTQDIDAAFESRIHLSLQYAELDADCRYQIWKAFLKTCELVERDFSEERLREIAETKMNGRQIKNTIKSAQLLAVKKASPLTIEHVHTVMKLKAANNLIQG